MLAAGVEHVGGDMFVSVPKGDAIFMKVGLNLSEIPSLSCRHACLTFSWVQLYKPTMMILIVDTLEGTGSTQESGLLSNSTIGCVSFLKKLKGKPILMQH